jgi:zinc protease
MTSQPKTGEMKAYCAPKRMRFELSNGIRVIFVEDRRQPLITARMSFRGGTSLVSDSAPGHIRAMGEILTEGTKSRDAKGIAEEADGYGGAIGTRTGRDSVVLTSYALSEHLGRMFDLMREVAVEPSFPEEEIKLRMENMLEELKISRSAPDFLAAVAFNRRLYGKHPYAIVAPTEEAIKTINRDALVDLHKRIFDPSRCEMVIVGDAALEDLKNSLETRFGTWRSEKSKTPPETPIVDIPESARRGSVLYDRAGSEQATIIMGDIALREDHPDFFPLLLANQVLGGSFAARLATDIRQKRGYTYGIYSYLSTYLRAGVFTIRTQTRTAVVDKTIQATLEHIDEMCNAPVKNAELEQAKNMLVGDFARELETQGGLAEAVLHGILRNLPDDHLDTHVKCVQKVSVSDVQEAAKKYFRPEALVISVVGDGEKLKEALKVFGPVALVDHAGHEVQ